MEDGNKIKIPRKRRKYKKIKTMKQNKMKMKENK